LEVSPKRYQLKSEFWMVFGLKFSGLGDGKFLGGQVSQGTMRMKIYYSNCAIAPPFLGHPAEIKSNGHSGILDAPSS